MGSNRTTFTITSEILRLIRRQQRNPLAAALTHYGLLKQPEITGIKPIGTREERERRLTYRHSPPVCRWLLTWQKEEKASQSN